MQRETRDFTLTEKTASFSPSGKTLSQASSEMRTIAIVSIVSALILSTETPTFAQDNAPVRVAEPSNEGRASPKNETSSQTRMEPVRDIDTRESICLIIESAARANDLPLEFFARVIWQESRFQSNAIGPVTRNGQRAQGIAQFMPGTASERRLLDPFDPVQALPKSAEFLSELRKQFGNLGLAAAAYNAGPKRVRDWLAGSGYIPQETRNYVSAITGSSVDEWATAESSGKKPERPQAANCREVMALLEQAPNRFVTQLERRVTFAATRRWGVQIAAGFNRDNALAMYARAMKGLNDVIGSPADPGLLALLFRVRGTGSFYQVRIGTDMRRQADDLCSRIRRSGGACIVKRNTGASSGTVPLGDKTVTQLGK